MGHDRTITPRQVSALCCMRLVQPGRFCSLTTVPWTILWDWWNLAPLAQSQLCYLLGFPNRQTLSLPMLSRCPEHQKTLCYCWAQHLPHLTGVTCWLRCDPHTLSYQLICTQQICTHNQRTRWELIMILNSVHFGLTLNKCLNRSKII